MRLSMLRFNLKLKLSRRASYHDGSSQVDTLEHDSITAIVWLYDVGLSRLMPFVCC